MKFSLNHKASFIFVLLIVCFLVPLKSMAQVSTTVSSTAPDLNITLNLPSKAVLGSGAMISALIKDLNNSNPEIQSIITSIISNNQSLIVDTRNAVQNIGPDGLNYKFNVDASKFNLGKNSVMVKVNVGTSTESSSTASINVVSNKNVKIPYGNGTILISKFSGRAYLVKDKMKQYISTIEELKKYRKNRSIKVSDNILSLYQDFITKQK
ncbi:MAG: hypothetical protein WCP18_00665 [bacterium]